MIVDSSALVAVVTQEATADACLAALMSAPIRRVSAGSRHRARLNFGDCFAYALARVYDEPLLFVGNDFIHTDLQPALGPT